MSEKVDFSEAIVVDDGIMGLQVHIDRGSVLLKYGDNCLACSERSPTDHIRIYRVAENEICVSHSRPRASHIKMYAKGAVLYGDQYQVTWDDNADGFITRVRI